MPSARVAGSADGLGALPLTQSGSGAALDDVAPLVLIAAFFFRGAMHEEGQDRVEHRIGRKAPPHAWPSIESESCAAIRADT